MNPPYRFRPLMLFYVLASTSACSGDSFLFFETTRTPVEKCEITPDGEFCSTEGLVGRVIETWSLEKRAEQRFVYVNDDVWVIDVPTEQNDDAEESWTSRQVVIETREPGPCTAQTTRTLALSVQDEALAGTLWQELRLTGVEECGETPTGESTSYNLDGVGVDAP